MLHFGQPVLDAVVAADPIEDVRESASVAGSVGELDAVVGQRADPKDRRKAAESDVPTDRTSPRSKYGRSASCDLKYRTYLSREEAGRAAA